MQLPSPGFELDATSPFPMTLTITPRAFKAMCVLKQLKSPSHSVSDDSLIVRVSDRHPTDRISIPAVGSLQNV